MPSNFFVQQFVEDHKKWADCQIFPLINLDSGLPFWLEIYHRNKKKKQGL